MKPAEFKRVLFVFSLCCVLFFIYLYWQQSASITASKLVYTYRRAFTKQKRVHPPQWTWQCVNQRCERRHVSPALPLVSLTTCSMLCGSTQLWPQPTGPVNLGSRALTFTLRQLDLVPVAQPPALDLLHLALAAFNANVAALVPDPASLDQPPSDLTRLLVQVTVLHSDSVRLRLATDESYTLTLRPPHAGATELVANVTAATFFGARHGLETLSQLIWWDEYGGALKVVKGASVRDAPAFAYRGVMVDTARNYMSLEALKRVVVGMAANKLNVFHWHATDSQSFPLLTPRAPQLARAGAYGPDQVYTPEAVRELVEFARARGVRVVIEVDAPAHAGNGWTWGPREGLGELAVCVNERPWSLYCGEPPCGQLNPDNPHVYGVLEKVYADILELTGEDEIFHLGGDEVNLECWAQHLRAAANRSDLHEVWGEFTARALRRLEAANGGRRVPVVVVWSSALSKRPYAARFLDKREVAVQSWGASQWPDTADLVADGYRVVVSHVDAWYLDCGFGRWRETGEAACDPYRPWQTVYLHRPWQQLRLERGRVLGGEACLWSEQLDEGALDARLWPRAAAFAERVWSDPRTDAAAFAVQEDVYTRLATQRERLAARGLGAEAMWPAWCVQNPGMCL